MKKLQGIKQCVNWLIDNQGEELICIEDNRVYGDAVNDTVSLTHKRNEGNSSLKIIWGTSNGSVCYTVFDECVWSPVIPKFTLPKTQTIIPMPEVLPPKVELVTKDHSDIDIKYYKDKIDKLLDIINNLTNLIE